MNTRTGKRIRVTDLIDRLGGNQAVAAITGVSPKAVSNWRANGRFPAATYLALSAELAVRGIYAPDALWTMRQAARRKKPGGGR